MLIMANDTSSAHFDFQVFDSCGMNAIVVKTPAARPNKFTASMIPLSARSPRINGKARPPRETCQDWSGGSVTRGLSQFQSAESVTDATIYLQLTPLLNSRQVFRIRPRGA